MNIGININCLIFQKAGVGRYTKNLLKHLLEIDKKNHYFLYASFIRRKKERKAIVDKLISETKAKNVTYKNISIPAAWLERATLAGVPLQTFIKDDLDLFYAPYFSDIPKKGFSKMVVTLYDLVFMHYPGHRGKKLSKYYLKRTKLAIKNSKKIIAISEATKKDLVKMLDVSESKIKVIPLGVTDDFRIISDNREIMRRTVKYVPKNIKYILTVGTLEPRKNLSALVRAYSLLPAKLQIEYKLVFAGGKGWNNEEFEKTIDEYNMQDKILFTGYIPDEDLPYLYNRAEVFVYPSLYEGFGLPPLEAMACGVPVITSNTSSLPEVIGKAGILIDPQKDEDIAQAIKKALLDKNCQRELSQKGTSQAKKFSWKKNARETLKVFEETVK